MANLTLKTRLLAGCFATTMIAAMPINVLAQQMETFPTPARGYLNAHRDVDNPFGLLGGPIDLTIDQDGGSVFVALPDQRELDATVFGTPDRPLAYGGFPVVQGVPPTMRGAEAGEFTLLQEPSPFGDAHATMSGASLTVSATDATATDAAVSEDSVDMTASWQDEEGNTYTVRCCDQLTTVGVQHPTFGGVVTNHLLHGISSVGTPLMPTMVAFFAFWGEGEVLMNGEVIDGPRPVHGMLTEYVRGEGYELAFDEQVNPEGWHFHVMVAPVAPNPDAPGGLEPNPVDTGFTLPNGNPLPFWHVMFEGIQVSSERGEE